MAINRSVTDLSKKTQEILELCKRGNEPVFLKDDGHDELVIMLRDYFNLLWSLLITLEEEQMNEKELANHIIILTGRIITTSRTTKLIENCSKDHSKMLSIAS